MSVLQGGLLIFPNGVFWPCLNGRRITMLARFRGGVPRLKEDAMKRKIGLTLATGLALLVAGCSSQGGGSSLAARRRALRRRQPQLRQRARNFNLAVKCPGVHWEKTHGWSDQQIMEQESIEKAGHSRLRTMGSGAAQGLRASSARRSGGLKAPAPGALQPAMIRLTAYETSSRARRESEREVMKISGAASRAEMPRRL